MASSYAGVALEDAQAARNLLDSWLEEHEGFPDGMPAGEALLVLRGMIAQLAADVREAGYLEGAQRGRRDIANLVRDALVGEGL